VRRPEIKPHRIQISSTASAGYRRQQCRKCRNAKGREFCCTAEDLYASHVAQHKCPPINRAAQNGSV